MLLFVTLLGCALGAEPLLEQAARDPLALKSLFAKFTSDNQRVYATPLEAKLRLGNFRRFIKDAARINAEHAEVDVGVTFFADMTLEEKKMYHGANMTAPEGAEADGEVEELPEALEYGASKSWRSNYGAIKNQGRCASCWAFGAAGVAEGFQSISSGGYVALSEQHVLDCSGAGNCRSGGYHLRALNWIKSGQRLATMASYRYSGRQGRCAGRNHNDALSIRVNSIYQARGDRRLASAIAKGPVAVLLYNFHGVGIEGYKSGVLSADLSEASMPGAMNHIVVAVGYTDSNWELRNSWGSGWGSGGYFNWKRSTYNNRGISDYAYTMTYSRAAAQEVEVEE